jgi:hypothetical protein
MALYQQGSGKITVIVRKVSDGGGGSRDEKNTESPDEKNAEKTGGDDGGSAALRRKKSFARATAMSGVQLVKHFAQVTMNMRVADIGRTTGDKALQDKIARDYEIMYDGVNGASTIAMSAIGGAWFGPVGIAVGAIAGAANVAMNLHQKYENRQRDYNLEIFKENAQIERMRSRSMINFAFGRLR